jgi:hypothetical protein
VLSRKVESSKRRSWPIRFCHQAAFSNAPRHCVRGRFSLVASSRWHNLRAAYRGLTFWPSLCGRHANQPGLLLQRYSKPGEDREARPRSPSGGEGSGASSLPIARIGRLKASDCEWLPVRSSPNGLAALVFLHVVASIRHGTA